MRSLIHVYHRLDTFLNKFDAHLHFLLQLGVTSIIIGILVYPKFPLISVPGTYVSIRAEDFLIAITTLIWIMYLRHRVIDLLKLSTTRAILLFLGIGLLSTLSALFITQNVLTQPGQPMLMFLHTFRRFEYLIVFFLVYSSIRNRQDVYFYIKALLIATLFIFAYGFGQKTYGLPIISTMNNEYSQGIAQFFTTGSRINSTFAGHYDLAAFSVIMMNILFGLLVATRGFKSRAWIILNLAAVLWLLIASSSRISFAAYLGSIVLTLWFLRRKLWIPPVIIISLIASLMAPTLLQRYADSLKLEFVPRLAQIEWPWERLGQDGSISQAPIPIPTPTPRPNEPTPPPSQPVPQDTPTPTPTPRVREVAGVQVQTPPPIEDRSTAIRFNVEWPRAIRAFIKNPLLGTGYSSITLATDNDYLRALGETGLLGLASLLLIFLTLFNRAKSWIFAGPIDPSHAIVIGIAGATLGFLANALFIDVFEASKIAILYWILAALMLALINHEKKDLK